MFLSFLRKTLLYHYIMLYFSSPNHMVGIAFPHKLRANVQQTLRFLSVASWLCATTVNNERQIGHFEFAVPSSHGEVNKAKFSVSPVITYILASGVQRHWSYPHNRLWLESNFVFREANTWKLWQICMRRYVRQHRRGASRSKAHFFPWY